MEYQCGRCKTPCNILRKIWARLSPWRCKHCSRLKEREEAEKFMAEPKPSEFLKKVTCNREVIHILGGATLKCNGGFHVCCIGKTCEEYPCERVEGTANER
jgi:DNA-directed RNA polymerase subunit RPC12/RpoP